MLIAYLDEFGHVGPYVEHGHPKFGQHPVFGFAGFIVPASAVRAVGAKFSRQKNELFKTEIEKKGTIPAHWERKGSEYFTSGSIRKRPEQIRVFKSLISFLASRGGVLFYYGDEKKRGTRKETQQEPTDVVRHALRQTINRICRYAEEERQDVLILMDSITEKTRRELAAEMYGHIFTRKEVEMKRIVEAPLHIESKLNSGIQLADWICALVTRASHYQLVRGSEFSWASEHFKSSLHGLFTYQSKLRLLYGDDIHHSLLLGERSARHSQPASSVGDRIDNADELYDAIRTNRRI